MIEEKTPAASYPEAKTVRKAFALLEHIADNQPARPAELGRVLKMTRANVHRLLATLVSLGYVERVDEHGYRLTYKLFRLGNAVVEGSDLREAAHPLLVDLSREVGEDACLTVLHDRSVVIVERIKSTNLLTLDHDVAHIYPLHCSGSGKIFLAAMEDALLDRLLSETGLPARTEHTITERDRLLRELQLVREKGYALDLGEYSEDIRTVAGPVYDHTRRLIATISVSGPTHRLDDAKLDRLIVAVRRACAELSRRMGCDATDPPIPRA